MDETDPPVALEGDLAALDIASLHAAEAEFADATSLGVITVDSRGVPVTPACGFSQFCLAIRQNPRLRARCHQCDAHGGLQAVIDGRPRAYRCHTGLIDFSVPIVSGRRYLGAILCGQVRLEGEQAPGFLLGSDDSWQADESLHELRDEIRPMSLSRVQAASNVLARLTRGLVQADPSFFLPIDNAKSLSVPSGRKESPASSPSSVAEQSPFSSRRPMLVEPATRSRDERDESTTQAPHPSFLSLDDRPDNSAVGKRLTAIARSLADEDLPAAMAATTAHLDVLFAWADTIAREQLAGLEDVVTQMASHVSPAARDAVRHAVGQQRHRRASALTRHSAQLYAESLLVLVVDALAKATPGPPTMKRLLNHLARQPQRDWTLTDAAAYLGLSFGHTSKRFKAHTGETFVAYISRRRLERARLLLRHTDLPVAQIAHDLGFRSNYFSRLFKEATGMTPREYRS
ncbi:MAG: PocR ligand-binding domain-containing protein [Propionibacteriaceae bacterium]|jgi:ligand-binding sensor protein/AraC-like DNA-binding protein|nr:PocR ligand-binding domain-containing protein [Propionibacteriaceae bacterium]